MTLYSKKELRKEIFEIIERTAGVSIPKKQYAEIEKQVLKHIFSLIIKGEKVPIGTLGHFFLRQSAVRTIYLPHIPEGTQGGGKLTLRFKVGSRVKNIEALEEKVGVKKDDSKKRSSRGFKNKKVSSGATTKSKTINKQKDTVKRNKRVSKRK